MPHPFVFFANGWDRTDLNLPLPIQYENGRVIGLRRDVQRRGLRSRHRYLQNPRNGRRNLAHVDYAQVAMVCDAGAHGEE